MKVFPLSNIWQELFEAIANGSTAFQLWGIFAGVVVLFLFILKPILAALQPDQRILNDQLSDNLTWVAMSINKLKERVRSNKNLPLNELYRFKYKQNKSLLYFTNTSLRPDFLEVFFSYLFKTKMTSGYIICKKTELDCSIFKQVLELKSSVLKKRKFKNDSIHLFNEQFFNYEALLSFPVTETIYFRQIGEIVDTKNE